MSGLPLTVGRYELHAELASGGMAVVHIGRLRGDAGFARAVAIKRLHRHYVGDPELSALLVDEARIASQLQHPNVVAPQDLLMSGGEIFLVMEYVHGLTLTALTTAARARGESVPVPIVSRVLSDVLAGLHAAHESRDGQGRLLAVVHRDVSPQNVMVGADGLARVLDFGIAQAAFRSQTTREGQLRAKLAYAAPEHVLDQPVDRRADVYSAAVVAWELLTLERLFTAGNESALLARVLEQAPRLASELRPEVSPELDALLASALSKNPTERPSTAEDFAVAIERVAATATHREVARWLASLGHETLARLAKRKAELEAGGVVSDSPAATPTSTSFARSVDTRTSDVAVPSGDTNASPALLHTRRVRPAWSRSRVGAAVCVLFGMLVVAPALLGRKVSLGSRASAALSPMRIVDPAGPGPASAGVGPGQAKGLGGDDVALHALAEPAPTDIPTGGSAAAATEPAPVSVPPKRIIPSSAPRPAAKARAIPYNEDCSQLTEVDSQGIRRVKRQCLR